MELYNFTRLLLLLSCTAYTLAYKRPDTKRENSPYSDDLLTSDTKNEGFFEDINFKSFFEDVGLKSAHSAPEAIRHQEPSKRRDRYQLHGEAQSSDYGFLPAEPLFKPSESRNRFTVISSDNDFYAQESSPFDDFYGFDSSPFAASQHHRDYISPYSESRQTENFEDYGVPKGFFDHNFAADFSGDKKNNNEKATQESKDAPKYGSSEPSQKEKDKTKKCETVHKDKMTCEICKDDFGGFSEHCSHSLHSGKDQKYANSRRRAHEDTYNPLNNQGHQGNQGNHGNHERKGNQGNHGGNKDGASSINSQAYHSVNENEIHTPNEDEHKIEQKPTDVQKTSKNTVQSLDRDRKLTAKENRENPNDKKVSIQEEKVPEKNEKEVKKDNNQELEVAIFARKSPVNDAYSENQQSGTTQKKDNNNNFYNPFPEQSEVSPYNFDYLKEIDEMISSGLKDISDQQNKMFDKLPKKTTKSTKDNEDTKDTEKQASNKEPQQNEAEPSKHKTPAKHPNLPVYPKQYKPLNPVENFKVLGKMVKQFSNKDRSNCKKRVTKKGMTCYVCPNKHGQVDEECMYENKDPSQGVHMMYKEEFSY